MPFYGAEQARIHHERFGDLAADAATLVLDRLRQAGLASGRVTDLGCGSGILAGRLVAAGYDVTGIDLSADMVELARVEAPGGTFRVGSVHDADLPPSVAVTAVGEVLNYATDARAGLDAVGAVASRAFDALAPGGVFACDISAPGRNFGLDVRHVFHDHESWILGMHATESGGRLDRRIVILLRDGDGRYRRVEEHHELVLFDTPEIVARLEAAGFNVEVRATYTETTPSTPPAGWAVFVATKAH